MKRNFLVIFCFIVIILSLFSCSSSRSPENPANTPTNNVINTFTMTKTQTLVLSYTPTMSPTFTEEFTMTSTATITQTPTVTNTPYYNIFAYLMNKNGEPRHEIYVKKNSISYPYATCVVTDISNMSLYNFTYIPNGQVYICFKLDGAEYAPGHTYRVDVTVDNATYSETISAPGGNVNVTDIDLINGIYCTWDVDGLNDQINVFNSSSSLVAQFYDPGIDGNGIGYNIPVSVFAANGIGTYTVYVYVKNEKYIFDTLSNSAIIIYDNYIKQVEYNP